MPDLYSTFTYDGKDMVITMLTFTVIVMFIHAPGKARGDDLTSWGFVAERGLASTRLASALH